MRFLALFCLSAFVITGCSTVVESQITQTDTYLCNTKKIKMNYFSNEKSMVQLVIGSKKSMLKKTTVNGVESYLNTQYIWKPEGTLGYLFDKSSNSNMACKKMY